MAVFDVARREVKISLSDSELELLGQSWKFKVTAELDSAEVTTSFTVKFIAPIKSEPSKQTWVPN